MCRPRRDASYLEDILEAAERVRHYIDGHDLEDFLRRPIVQDAVLRNIEVIGEATKLLSSDLRNRTPNVPWQSMAGMRDRIIHHYFGVNLEIVWDVARTDLPLVAAQVREILADLGATDEA